MLKDNFLKKLFESKRPAIGTWNIINSYMVVDVIASSGIDFIVFDAEHGAIDFDTAQLMGGICESYSVSPIMRVGEINESLILRALDIGMHGVQLPNIGSKDDAEKFVSFAKYPPVGTRGFSPYTKAGLYDSSNGGRLISAANSNTLLIANVEGEDGFRNLDDISKVEGIDIVFIGLFDLSKSLGLAGQVEHPKVLEKLDEAISIVHGNNKLVGSIASNLGMLKQMQAKNIDYLTYSVDTGIIKEAYELMIDSFRGQGYSGER